MYRSDTIFLNKQDLVMCPLALLNAANRKSILLQKYKRAISMTAVWQYFRLDQPASKTTTCLICHTAILSGGTSICNTTNLIKHLKMRHPVEHDGYTKAKAEKDEPCQTQQTFGSFIQTKRKVFTRQPTSDKDN